MRIVRHLIPLALAACAPPTLSAPTDGDHVVARADVVRDGDCSYNVDRGDGLAIANPKIAVLFYGGAWTSASQTSYLTQAWSDLANHPELYAPLVQYGGGPGSYAGSFVSPANPVRNTNGNVDEKTITDRISKLVQHGSLPAEDANTIYLVFLPNHFLAQSDYGQGDAHHDVFDDATSGVAKVRYGVVEWHEAPEASIRVGWHEVAEAISDPESTSWGSDKPLGEIADICRFNPIPRLDGHFVASVWSNANCACVGPNTREAIDGSVANFEALSSSDLWVLDDQRNLWRENGASRNLVATSVRTFKSDGTTSVWFVDFAGTLWYERLDVLSQTAIGRHIENMKAAGGAAYFTHTGDRTLYRAAASGATDVVDGNVLNFFPLDANHVYVAGTDRNLWLEYPGTSTPRTLIDGNVAAFAAAGGRIYVLGTDGKLWNEIPGWGHGPDPVDASVGLFHPLDGSFVFVSGAVDGRIWREHGDWTHRDYVDANAVTFQPVDVDTIFVLGRDGWLWREHLPTATP